MVGNCNALRVRDETGSEFANGSYWKNLKAPSVSEVSAQRAIARGAVLLDAEVWDLAANSLCGSSNDVAALSDSSMVVNYVHSTCKTALGIDIDAAVLTDYISPMCIGMGSSSVFLAQTVMRSRIMDELVGKSLAGMLSIYVHAQEWCKTETLRNLPSMRAVDASESATAHVELAKLKASVLAALV